MKLGALCDWSYLAPASSVSPQTNINSSWFNLQYEMLEMSNSLSIVANTCIDKIGIAI